MFYEGEQEDELGDLDEEVQQLNQAWQTEVHCPEVLPFKKELIESITQRISDQQVRPTLFHTSDHDAFSVFG
jgi:hypothetical protein